jgi:parallel beta-helix repeat protein
MKKQRRLTVAIVAAAGATALLTVGAGAALAKKGPPVACGQVVTHSIHLKNDLTDCPGPGLVVGADHIRIDLGGHTIDGVNNPAADGIDNTGGFDNVLVRHGTIQQFQQGVELVDASRNTLRRLTVQQTFRGIELGTSDHTKIDHNRVTANFDGIHLVTSTHNRISHNNVFGNSASAIVLITGSDNNKVDHNKAHHNTSWGITSDFSDGNVFDHNRVYRNDIAGIEPFHGANLRITHNAVFRNQIGIELFTITGSLLRGNTVRGSVGDGIHAFQGSTGNRLLNNSAHRNGANGINVEDSGNTIRRNHANRNHDLGIFAAAGNIDGGGNTAHHNGNAAQCVGVTCH